MLTITVSHRALPDVSPCRASGTARARPHPARAPPARPPAPPSARGRPAPPRQRETMSGHGYFGLGIPQTVKIASLDYFTSLKLICPTHYPSGFRQILKIIGHLLSLTSSVQILKVCEIPMIFHRNQCEKRRIWKETSQK